MRGSSAGLASYRLGLSGWRLFHCKLSGPTGTCPSFTNGPIFSHVFNCRRPLDRILRRDRWRNIWTFAEGFSGHILYTLWRLFLISLPGASGHEVCEWVSLNDVYVLSWDTPPSIYKEWLVVLFVTSRHDIPARSLGAQGIHWIYGRHGIHMMDGCSMYTHFAHDVRGHNGHFIYGYSNL